MRQRLKKLLVAVLGPLGIWRLCRRRLPRREGLLFKLALLLDHHAYRRILRHLEAAATIHVRNDAALQDAVGTLLRPKQRAEVTATASDYLAHTDYVLDGASSARVATVIRDMVAGTDLG